MSAEMNPARRRGLGSIMAVATLGLCAVAILSITALVRMDAQRTHVAADEAQAVALLAVGSDAVLQRLRMGGGDEGFAVWSVDLPKPLVEAKNARLLVTPLAATDAEEISFRVEAEVRDSVAKQVVRLERSGPARDDWGVARLDLQRVYTPR